MAKIKKSSLGIGLGELLSDVQAINSLKAVQLQEAGLAKLAVEQLYPGKYQPRRKMQAENLQELADSIRVQGIIQPLIVRPGANLPNGNHSYEIIAGERRWRAAQLAGLDEVPALIRELSDQDVVALSLIENIQREDLNAIEIALSLQQLIADFQMTHEQAAVVIGKSRTMVTNLLRLLSLVPAVQELVQQGALEMGHARALLGVVDPVDQLKLAKLVVDKKLSVRECENLVKRQKSSVGGVIPSDPNLLQLQRELTEKLTAAVKFLPSRRGGGRIVIKYHSLDELENILLHIK